MSNERDESLSELTPEQALQLAKLIGSTDHFLAEVEHCLVPLRADGQGDQLVGMLAAVAAVLTFLNTFDGRNVTELKEPFVRLQGCIWDLLNGVTPVEFRLDRGRNRDNTRTKMFQLNCAIAMDLLFAAGMRKNEAAATVARRFSRLQISASSVEDWRDDLMGSGGSMWSAVFNAVTGNIKASGVSLLSAKAYLNRLAAKNWGGVRLRHQPGRAGG